MARPRVPFSFRPALWLTADAALAASVAWPAEALLLFLLSPDLPFTLGGFFATMVALLPQVLAVFVFAGPLLVLFFTSLRVGKNTRRGLSTRYVLRFALLDAVLLAAAAVHQWRSVGLLLPDLARAALGLTATSLAAAAIVALVLVAVDVRRPRLLGPAWPAALGIALLVPLGLAGDLRRVRVPVPVPSELPGFDPTRRLLVIEVPGLDLVDLEQSAARGSTPALEDALQRGALFRVDGYPLVDPVALHATLVTGRDPRNHGVLAGVRYRPTTGAIAFGIFPRGLLLRPLLLTPLWERVPVGASAVRTVGLPGIASGLGLPFALIGDPLGSPLAAPDSTIVPRAELVPRHAVAGVPGATCPDPPTLQFNPPAPELPSTPALAAEVRGSLGEDLCALGVARALFAGPRPPAIALVRLAGYGRVAWHFAGWRDEKPARGATEPEIAAYKWTMARYLRLLDPEIGRLVAAAGPGALVAVVSPLGVRAREDVGRIGTALIGETGPTGTFAGPPPGLVVLAGDGVRAGERLPGTVPLTAVLPTLLWAAGLPAAEDMGPIVNRAFRSEYVEAHPVVMVPSFAANGVVAPPAARGAAPAR